MGRKKSQNSNMIFSKKSFVDFCDTVSNQLTVIDCYLDLLCVAAKKLKGEECFIKFGYRLIKTKESFQLLEKYLIKFMENWKNWLTEGE